MPIGKSTYTCMTQPFRTVRLLTLLRLEHIVAERLDLSGILRAKLTVMPHELPFVIEGLTTDEKTQLRTALAEWGQIALCTGQCTSAELADVFEQITVTGNC